MTLKNYLNETSQYHGFSIKAKVSTSDKLIPDVSNLKISECAKNTCFYGIMFRISSNHRNLIKPGQVTCTWNGSIGIFIGKC